MSARSIAVLAALWRSPRAFALLVALAALVPRLVGIDDAWSTHEWSGEFGAFATGTPARNFLEHGFLETWGVPFTTRVELADGSALHWYYLHHPPTYMWFAGAFLWLFGPVEWGLRLLAVFGSTAAAVAGYVFARRIVGERAARVAACVWIAAPYGLRDGLQLWTEVPIAGTSAMALVAYLAWLDERSPRRLVHLCAWYGAGCALDWPAHFYGPVFALHALGLALVRRDRRMLAAPLALLGVSLLSIGLVAAHFVLVVGADELANDFDSAMASAAGESHRSWIDAVTSRGFITHQWNGFAHAMTTPGTLLFLLGLAALPLARRPARESVLVLLAVLPGLAYVGAFPGRSANHMFFMAIALPALSALVGAGAEALARGAACVRQRGGGWTAVVCGVCVLVSGLITHHVFRSRTVDSLLRRIVEYPAIAEVLADDRAVIFAQPGRGAWLGFHSRAPVWVRTLHAEQLHLFVTRELARLESTRAAYVFVDLTAWQHPQLPEELREHFRTLTEEFDRVVRSFGSATVFEIVDDFGVTQRFGLYRLPTGGVPLAEEAVR